MAGDAGSHCRRAHRGRCHGPASTRSAAQVAERAIAATGTDADLIAERSAWNPCHPFLGAGPTSHATYLVPSRVVMPRSGGTSTSPIDHHVEIPPVGAPL